MNSKAERNGKSTRRLAALLAAALVAAAIAVSPAFGRSSISSMLSVLTNPPVQQKDIFEPDQLWNDVSPAGTCVDYSTVVDPTSARSSDTLISMQIEYASAYRQSLARAAALSLRSQGMHLAIWLYHWNGRAWVWAGQSRFRYPNPAGYEYLWRNGTGDSSTSYMPHFWVASGSGHYTIRVAIITSAGQVAESAYVRGFGHGDLTYTGITSYCTS